MRGWQSAAPQQALYKALVRRLYIHVLKLWSLFEIVDDESRVDSPLDVGALSVERSMLDNT